LSIQSTRKTERLVPARKIVDAETAHAQCDLGADEVLGHPLGEAPSVDPGDYLIDRHEVLADLLGQLTDRGKKFNTVAEYRKQVEIMRYRLRYTRGQVTWTAEPASYFRDNAGVAFGADQLYFEFRKGAPARCRVPPRKSRFHTRGDDQRTIGPDRDGEHFLIRAAEGQSTQAGFHVDQACRAILARGGQPFAVVGKTERHEILAVLGQSLKLAVAHQDVRSAKPSSLAALRPLVPQY
jgi:hypothetical protein